MRHFPLIALIAAAALASPALAKDPRPPSPEHRAHIEHALKSQGFVRWSGIRMDDDGPEVDSAWDAQGRRFELKLHPQTLKVIRTERED